MYRVLLYALLFYLGYLALKSMGRRFFGDGGHGTPEESSHDDDAELIKDPQCGAYFLKQRGIAARIGDKVVYFCSETCRDEYIRRHK
jgi:hypothetical protein